MECDETNISILLSDQVLKHPDLANRLYKSMNEDDLAEPILAVLEIIKELKEILPRNGVHKKSEDRSTKYRENGNEEYKKGNYRKALSDYNNALLWAPKNSRAMKLAYSNRSALLLKIGAVHECNDDISTIIQLGCPDDLKEKLMKRCLTAISYYYASEFFDSIKIFANHYFALDFKRNPDVPCVSKDVDVKLVDESYKIVANSDIKVGTVVCIEKGFITSSTSNIVSCYYCKRFHFNLHPCDGCCKALFCSEICRTNCMNEYHRYECKIMDSIVKCVLEVKAALKLRCQCESWKQFIAHSKCHGNERIMKSTTKQLFNSEIKESILCFTDDKHFVSGKMFFRCIEIAVIINNLQNHDFLPNSTYEKLEAIRAFGRIMMYLSLYGVKTEISYSAVNQKDSLIVSGCEGYGYFPFTGKIKHSCIPNIEIVGLGTAVALIALQPIKPSDELTVSYSNQFERHEPDRRLHLFLRTGTICNCPVCMNKLSLETGYSLSEVQKKYLKQLNNAKTKTGFSNVASVFPKVCKTLAALSNIPYSVEYKNVYTQFMNNISAIQCALKENVLV